MSKLTTSAKRALFPARYARKDARTRIYRALYGEANTRDPQGRPELNETRKLPELFSFLGAEELFKANLETANFSPAQRAVLERRLETLRTYKPRKVA